MKAVVAFFLSFWTWLRNLFEQPYRFEFNEGYFPSRLHRRRIYILTEDGEPWEARMVCPCGCGDELDLSLLPDDHPTWTFSTDRQGRASLRPSVWRHVGCRSHFFVTHGSVRWV